MFFERRCPGCRSLTTTMCASCWGQMAPSGVFDLPGLDLAIAAYDYDEVSRPMVLAAKNGGRRDLLRALGGQLGRVIAASIDPATVDAVAWVPASIERRRSRGVDQGRILAKAVGRAIGRPHRSLLARVDHDTQYGKDLEQRRLGPTLRSRRRPPDRVLLVDDVVTTGASMVAAAVVLRAAGATQVVAGTVTVVGRPAATVPTSYCGRSNTSRDHPGVQWEVPRWR